MKLNKEYIKKQKKTVDKIIDDLNNVLKDKVNFSLNKDRDGNDLVEILVYEEKLKSKAGRPRGNGFDYEKVQQLKAEGKKNKEIYTELGISKALYYLRMKEYKK